VRPILWISFRGEDGRWKPARRMNTPALAVCPYVSPDGKFFFFLKFENGSANVYWMDASGLGLTEDPRSLGRPGTGRRTVRDEGRSGDLALRKELSRPRIDPD
jgi:hypothetical protein